MKFTIALLLFLTTPIGWALGQNENLSLGNIFDGEPYLAVNPADDQHLVVAWMGFVPTQKFQIKTRASFDGGLTWSPANLISHAKPNYSSPDPVLDFGPQGEVYLAYIDFDPGVDSGEVFLRKSLDGGLTWGAETEVIAMHTDTNRRAIDRPWMAVDRSGGAYNGHIYITTISLSIGMPVSPPYRNYLLRSTDGGASFQPFQYLDGPGFEVGSLLVSPMPTPTVSSNGTFYAVYPAWVISQNPSPRYILASSTDGGNQLNYQEVFTVQGATGGQDAKNGYLLRSNPTNPDHLAFIVLGTVHGDADVFLRESFDGGVNWNPAIRVNDDPIGNDRMQDLLWADFDDDGDLIVSWRDRRNGTDSTYETASEIWAAFRPRDSVNFLANFPISDTLIAYDSVLAAAGNDFMNIQLQNDTLYAVWGDTRTGKLNIWFQKMKVDGTLITAVLLADEATYSALVYPNPSTGTIRINAEQVIGCKVWNLEGGLVWAKDYPGIADKPEIHLDHLPRGHYLIEVSFEKGREVRRFELQ